MSNQFDIFKRNDFIVVSERYGEQKLIVFSSVKRASVDVHMNSSAITASEVYRDNVPVDATAGMLCCIFRAR